MGRIQLGLGPNDPLPEDDAEVSEAADDAAPVEVKLGQDSGSADSAEDKEPEPKDLVTLDPFAVESAKDVPELQKEESARDVRQKDGGNFFQALVTDFGLVTLPTPGAVLQTFGIVLGLVGLYTGFVAVVDY